MATTTRHIVCPHCGHRLEIYASENRLRDVPCASCGQMIGGLEIPRQTTRRPVSWVSIFVFVGIAGVFALLLYPAISTPRIHSRRAECGNNLRQISVAMQLYHDVHKSFPPAYVTNSQGEKLYSWRVLLLPFLERNDLYERFDKTKAWDAPENIEVSQQSLSYFRCPSDYNVEKNGSSYFVIVGDETAFPGTKSVGMGAITDGTSNTILVMEISGIQGSWAAPTDPRLDGIDLSIGEGASQIHANHSGGIQVALADGSVRFVSERVSPQRMRQGLIIADRQPTDMNDF